MSSSMAEYKPRNDIEERDAAIAVADRRKADEGQKLVASLTPRERLLVERAWEAGANNARAKLAAKLENPQAATLDADRVRLTVNHWHDSPMLFEWPGWRLEDMRYDRKVVALVRDVLKELEQVGEGQTQ